MTIQWTILNADVWTHDGKTDVIDAINWRCAWLVDGKERAALDGRVSIPYDPNASFAQFADLSETALIEMAHVAMGGAVAAVEARLIREATMRNETPPKVAERLVQEAAAMRAAPDLKSGA
jgi:hypothetical protein